jgi:hypothetical protein
MVGQLLGTFSRRECRLLALFAHAEHGTRLVRL